MPSLPNKTHHFCHHLFHQHRPKVLPAAAIDTTSGNDKAPPRRPFPQIVVTGHGKDGRSGGAVAAKGRG
jgi:hypothetical protein